MRFHYLFLVSTLFSILALSGCSGLQSSPEGVVAFSPEHDRVIIVTHDFRMFTTDLNGGNLAPLNAGNGIYGLFPVTLNPFGDKLLFVNQSFEICIEEIRRTIQCNPNDLEIPQGVIGGILSFLPDGDILFGYQSQGVTTMKIYHSNGKIVSEKSGIEQIFVTRDIHETKRNRWYINPYGTQPLHWVITTSQNDAFLYSVTSTSMNGPELLPGGIGSIREKFEGIYKKILSPDGKKVAFQTKDSTSNPATYNLYILDLSVRDNQLNTLVLSTTFPMDFSFSPDSSQFVYESNQGGRSVWIANANGSNPIRLADNASMPDWWP